MKESLSRSELYKTSHSVFMLIWSILPDYYLLDFRRTTGYLYRAFSILTGCLVARFGLGFLFYMILFLFSDYCSL